MYLENIGNIWVNRKKKYIYIYMEYLFINYRTFFDFCVSWALGGLNIGQKGGGMLTKLLPGRQTPFGEFFRAPFGENTFSKSALKTISSFFEEICQFCQFCQLKRQGRSSYSPSHSPQ